MGFPTNSGGKESVCDAGDRCVHFLGWEDPPGERKGYPLQYSGLENSMGSKSDLVIPGHAGGTHASQRCG